MLNRSHWGSLNTTTTALTNSSADTRTLTIIEPSPSGHHLVYVRHLIDAALRYELRVRLLTSTQATFCQEFRAHLGIHETNPTVEVLPVLPRHPTLRTARSVMSIVSSGTPLVIPDCDRSLPFLMLLRLLGARPISALLMRCQPIGPKEFLNHLLKRILVHMATFGRSCYIARLTGPLGAGEPSPSPLWVSLPTVNDPGPAHCPMSRTEAASILGIDPAQRWAVVAGEINERKSIPQILEWALSTELKPRPSVLLAGKVSPLVMKSLGTEEARSAITCGSLAIVPRFLGERELNAAYAIASAVLILHENDAPSGSFLYARNHDKPVLTWGSRHVSHAVEDLNLGLTIPDRSPRSLDEAFAHVVTEWHPKSLRSKQADPLSQDKAPCEDPSQVFLEQLLGPTFKHLGLHLRSAHSINVNEGVE